MKRSLDYYTEQKVKIEKIIFLKLFGMLEGFGVAAERHPQDPRGV